MCECGVGEIIQKRDMCVIFTSAIAYKSDKVNKRMKRED